MNILTIISSFIGDMLKEIPSACVQCGKDKKREMKEIKANRPEMYIVRYKTYKPGKTPKPNFPGAFNVFVARYNPDSLLNDDIPMYQMDDARCKKWHCIEYLLKNKGGIDISCLTFLTNRPQNVSVLYAEDVQQCFKRGLRQCAVYHNKKIKKGETVTLRIYWCNSIPDSFVSAAFKLNLEDDDHCFWDQGLFVPYDQIGDSYQVSFEEHRKDVNGYYADV